MKPFGVEHQLVWQTLLQSNARHVLAGCETHVTFAEMWSDIAARAGARRREVSSVTVPPSDPFSKFAAGARACYALKRFTAFSRLRQEATEARHSCFEGRNRAWDDV